MNVPEDIATSKTGSPVEFLPSIMPAKPAPIKKSAKKAAAKEEKPAEPVPETVPAEVPPVPETVPAEAAAVEAPAEEAVAEPTPAAEAPAPEGTQFISVPNRNNVFSFKRQILPIILVILTVIL